MAKESRKQDTETRRSLKESVKELRCLYDIARITGEHDKTINERLAEIVDILPRAFPHPEKTWARIIVGWEEYKTNNYRETASCISADIFIAGEKAGTVEIGSLKTSPSANMDMVASQQTLLINAVAERLGGIIEHRRSEDALRESEEKFSKAFQSNPAVVAIMSLKDGRIFEVNDNFTRFTGYTREEAMQLSFIDIGGWSGTEDYEKFLQTVKKQGTVRNMEADVRTRNGEKRTVIFSADLINFNSEPCVMTITLDVTQQKQLQEFLESISNASPLGIYIMQGGKIMYANPQFRKITGYSHQELLGYDLLKLVSAADKDIVQSSTLRTLRGEKTYPCEYRIFNKKGQACWVMQTVAPIHYQGKEAIMGNLMDITERKYLERKVDEYEELDKMKGDILATVSHELRTPLATIKGYATMILDYYKKLSADETMEYLISIDNSTDKLMKLVDNLLDSSRMDSGMLKLKKSPVSITTLIKSVTRITAMRIKNHRILTTLPRSLPLVNIDARRIRQVLENLINNAARYSPDDSEILVSAGRKDREIEISITDRGAEIPTKELKNIFDRMYKLEKSVYAGADGMGLGLHICKRLVEAHGGLIWAESAPVKGTTIHFTLPMVSRKKRAKIKYGQTKPVGHIL